MLRKIGLALLLIIGYAGVVVVGSFLLLWPAELTDWFVLYLIWGLWPFIVSFALGWWARKLLDGTFAAGLVGLLAGCVVATAAILLGLPAHWAYLIAYILPLVCAAVAGAILQEHFSHRDEEENALRTSQRDDPMSRNDDSAQSKAAGPPSGAEIRSRK